MKTTDRLTAKRGNPMLGKSRVSAAVLGAALIGVFAAAPASAQTSATASITATAAVVGVAPLTATGVNNLNFGTVTAGTPKTPTSLSADAGRFNITGEPSTPVTITFVLPTVLSGPGGPIPISFSPTDGLHWTSYPVSFITFNPNAAFGVSLDAVGNLTIGIAGTVSPPLGTTTGTYNGTVTLTVTY
jgi:spore coat protein U-like protein